MRSIALVTSLLFAPVIAASQPAPATAIKAARMLDGVTGQMIPNPVIIVQGDRITSVNGPAPAGARVIDLGDVTLMPGFIDLHTHVVSEISASSFTPAVTQTELDEATRHGLRVAAHAHGSDGIKAAIQAGVTSIEHGSMLDDETIALMKEHGTDRINLAIAAGVKIAFGTDAGVYPHGENAGEFVVYTKLGKSSIDAIRSATTVAAEALGKTDRDITATQHVSWVMVGGRIVRGN